MIRIALASIHPRSLSGQIEGLVGLAQALSSRGHQVQVVSPFPEQELLGSDRLELANTPRRIFIDQPARISRILTRLVHLAPRVDVIQLNLPTPAFSIFADLLQTLVHVPVLVGYETHLVGLGDVMRHGHLWQAPNFYLLRLLINNRLMTRVTLHHAAGYVVNSQYQKTELSSLGVKPDRIYCLPTVLPRDKWTRVARQTVRTKFPEGKLVTYVGHYNHVKGVDVLVRAFRTLAPQFPDLRLVLAWSGIGTNRCVDELLRDKAYQGRVFQLGRLHVQELLSASDMVVLPYRLTFGQAAHPTTLVEALAANVPVVTTDLPILRELVDDGRAALLVPPDDPAALASAIERVLNDSDLVQRMLQAQRQWIEQFQPACAVKAYERLYEQILTPVKATVL